MKLNELGRSALREETQNRVMEAKKRLKKNLCVNTGKGSGGGFTACNRGQRVAAKKASAGFKSVTKSKRKGGPINLLKLTQSPKSRAADNENAALRTKTKTLASALTGNVKQLTTDGTASYMVKDRKFSDGFNQATFSLTNRKGTKLADVSLTATKTKAAAAWIDKHTSEGKKAALAGMKTNAFRRQLKKFGYNSIQVLVKGEDSVTIKV